MIDFELYYLYPREFPLRVYHCIPIFIGRKIICKWCFYKVIHSKSNIRGVLAHSVKWVNLLQEIHSGDLHLTCQSVILKRIKCSPSLADVIPRVVFHSATLSSNMAQWRQFHTEIPALGLYLRNGSEGMIDCSQWFWLMVEKGGSLNITTFN